MGPQAPQSLHRYSHTHIHHLSYFPTTLLFLLISFIVLFSPGSSQTTTTCVSGDVHLNVSSEKRYIGTPSGPNEQYLPDISCRFILSAATGNRILLEIEEMNMEVQLFDECLDSVSIYKGNTMVKADNIVTLCGSVKDRQISSSDDNIVVILTSDDYFQNSGVRISYQALEPDRCDPGWKEHEDGSCFRLIEPEGGVEWTEAQAQCTEQQSNLASIPNESVYNFALDWLRNISTHPWIGYHDASYEGTVHSMIQKETLIWPHPQPPLNGNVEINDCLYLDLSTSHWKEGELAYRITDCRTKQSFICEKRKDGSTTLAPNLDEVIRNGARKSKYDYTFWLLILVSVILFIIIMYICCQACAKKRDNRVHSVDARAAGRNPPPNTMTSSTNQVGQHRLQTAHLTHPNVQVSTNQRGVSPQLVPRMSPKQTDQQNLLPSNAGGPLPIIHQEEHQGAVVVPSLVPVEPPMRVLPPLPIREATYHTLNTRDESYLRTKRAGELFERPKMNVLDNVSAISLDEFWSNKK